jgi:hypothetical protein
MNEQPKCVGHGGIDLGSLFGGLKSYDCLRRRQSGRTAAAEVGPIKENPFVERVFGLSSLAANDTNAYDYSASDVNDSLVAMVRTGLKSDWRV